MGNTSYNFDSRTTRAVSSGYYTKSVDQTFEQNAKRQAHESMNPKNIKIREARDSKEHPKTVPIALFLDITGSMERIPHEFIKDGLPTLMKTLVENGVPDAALLFGGVGDHLADNYPLQVGQFESGDEENDLWLSRVYIEGNGGGNGGESYPLGWQFVANYTVTDAWEKRKKKGFVFTIGDERPHKNYQKAANISIFGENAKQEGNLVSLEQLLADAQEKYHVYHLHYVHNSASESQLEDWKQILGENAIKVEDYRQIPKLIAKIVLAHETGEDETPSVITETKVEDSEPIVNDVKPPKKPKIKF